MCGGGGGGGGGGDVYEGVCWCVCIGVLVGVCWCVCGYVCWDEVAAFGGLIQGGDG